MLLFEYNADIYTPDRYGTLQDIREGSWQNLSLSDWLLDQSSDMLFSEGNKQQSGYTSSDLLKQSLEMPFSEGTKQESAYKSRYMLKQSLVPFSGYIDQPIIQIMSEPKDWPQYRRAYNPLTLTRSVAQSLDELHEKGAKAGGVDPSNVFANREGHIFIKPYGRNEDPRRENYRYSAPEAFTSVDPDGYATMSSDVYSFASLAYEIFTREKPFGDQATMAGVFREIVGGRKPKRPASSVSDWMAVNANWEFLLGCWDLDPGRRPSMREVVAFLSDGGEKTSPDADKKKAQDVHCLARL